MELKKKKNNKQLFIWFKLIEMFSRTPCNIKIISFHKCNTRFFSCPQLNAIYRYVCRSSTWKIKAHIQVYVFGKQDTDNVILGLNLILGIKRPHKIISKKFKSVFDFDQNLEQ